MRSRSTFLRFGCILLCLLLCATVVSCGKDTPPQLSRKELRAETDVLLHAVMESEWFHCWCSALSSPPFTHGPLKQPMEDFKGFMELIGREDFETVLLQFFEEKASTESRYIPHSAELLFLREETQEVLSASAIDRIYTILVGDRGQLSAQELQAETDVLLHTVLESFWFSCWCWLLPPSQVEHDPLGFPMKYFNGFTELIGRADFEEALLRFFEEIPEKEDDRLAHRAELLFLREETQEVLSTSAIEQIRAILEEK